MQGCVPPRFSVAVQRTGLTIYIFEELTKTRGVATPFFRGASSCCRAALVPRGRAALRRTCRGRTQLLVGGAVGGPHRCCCFDHGRLAPNALQNIATRGKERLALEPCAGRQVGGTPLLAVCARGGRRRAAAAAAMYASPRRLWKLDYLHGTGGGRLCGTRAAVGSGAGAVGGAVERVADRSPTAVVWLCTCVDRHV